MLRRLCDWLDERSGYRALVDAALGEPVPGGARVAYVFGSALAFLFVLQVTTGLLLAAFYAPSVSSAWAAVAYIQQEVTLGWFVRGLHADGASAMIILVIAHLLQVTIYGAYRRPRELNWYVGLLMMACLLAFALTGYLLPWDQKGYWATQVATSLLGATPAVGPWLKALVQGGPEYGNLTLAHFFTLHVVALPALLTLLLVAHLALFRRHGVTPGWRASAEELRARAQPFWPHQLLYDFLAMAVVLGVLVAAIVRSHGMSLEAPADPTAAYDARPEWYFLPLYQLLKYFPGRLEIVGAVGAPLVAGGLLVLLPLADRGPERRPSARTPFIGAVVLLLLGVAALGVRAELADRGNAGYQKARALAEREGRRALALALKGVPPAGGVAVYENDPVLRGRRLFDERCAGCHVLGGKGEARAPDLDGWSSRPWIAAFLKDPEAPRFFGRTKVRGMKPVKATGADLDALVEWVYSLGGGAGVDAGQAARGRELFDSSGCDTCHETDGKSAGDGAPNLGGRATREWTRALILDAAAEPLFGRKNQMTRFAGKLADVDVDALVDLLLKERAAAAN
jgi:ubiquinol-cytochrome c reductase cytochrome b subunit